MLNIFVVVLFCGYGAGNPLALKQFVGEIKARNKNEARIITLNLLYQHMKKPDRCNIKSIETLEEYENHNR